MGCEKLAIRWCGYDDPAASPESTNYPVRPPGEKSPGVQNIFAEFDVSSRSAATTYAYAYEHDLA